MDPATLSARVGGRLEKVHRVFEYTRGLYRSGNTRLYVNEGTGTRGPTLRLGTRSEITVFELSPV